MNAVNKSSEQPDMDQLLAESEANALSGHASDATITNLRGELETMANDLRTPVESDPFLKEPACSDAVEKARAIAKETIQTTAASKMEGAVHAEVSQIGPYKILALLGQGGMGAVYKALHPRLEKIVALKVLTPGRLKSHDAVGRFEREMKAIGKLDHPHLIRALDAGEADGAHYLAMEYVDGIDLSHLIKSRGPLPIPEACELVIQAASGLQAAHTRGMVHRDIKPANLMLARQEFGPPVVKVLDLGLALLSDTNAPDVGGLTSDGQVMGTVDYMAPEQATDSHSVDIRADIYSLGATLYALLTGGSLFQGKPNQSLMQKLMTLAKVPAPPIRDRRPEVSVALAAVVHRMIAKDARERYATPADVISALKPFAKDANLASLDSESGYFVATDSTSAASYEGTVLLDSVQTGGPTLPHVVSQSSHQQPPRRRWIPMAIAGAAIAAAGLLAIVLLTLKTPQGDVVVEIPGDLPVEVRKQIKISVTGDGVAEVASEANGWKVGIKEGMYSVELTGGGDQVQVDDKQVTVSRHKKAIVTITTKPTGTIATKPAGGANADPDRRAAEWILSIYEGPSNMMIEIVGGQLTDVSNRQLPAVPFRIHSFSLAGPVIEKLGDRLADELAAKISGIRPTGALFVNISSLTTAGFAKLVAMPEFSEVSKINLKCFDRGMDNGVFPLLAKLPNLTTILITPEPHLTGTGIGELKACSKLSEIGWQGGTPSPAALEELVQLPKLDWLGFNTIICTERHTKALAKLKIRTLGLHSCRVEDNMLRHLGAMENLETFNITHNPITDQGLTELKRLKNVTILHLQGTKVTAAGVADLQQALPNCKIEWDAPDPDRMAAEWLMSLKHPPKLDLGKDGNPWMSLQPGQPLPAEKFHMYYIQFNKPEHAELGDEFVDELAIHLRGITKIPRFQFNGRKLTAAGLAKLIRLPELADVQDLVISPDSMDDSMVADLAAMKKLTSLRIDRAPMITGKNMGHLKGIVGLILPECPNLTPEGLEELQQLPLELLDIGSVRLTEKHITAIAGHKTLRRLHSQGIDDSTVAGLANMKNLVWLGFENSQITDKGLQELKQFMGLKTVNGNPVVVLTGSKATPEGIADLKISLPNCRIE